ncbi:verprolin 1 [Lycorma delicatula]|uniref:verprolin 1 n=1 Tax=Lycorma delicatula TaxID=130591 RepID=UPI003F51702C
MPFPPPPPPPGPPLPPPSFPSGSPTGSVGSVDPNGRNLLLQSIRKGTALKKTVTNDRSAPAVGADGGGSSNNSINSSSSSSNPKSPSGANVRNINSGSATLGRNNGLAGLFAGGMPKLKPTGLDIGQSSNTSQSLNSLPLVANNSTLYTKQDGVRKQFSVDIKNRGPPPQPPPANQKPAMPQSASDSVLTGPMHSRSNSTTSLNSSTSLAQNNGWTNNNLNSNINNNNNNGNNNHCGLNRTVSKAPPGGYGKPNVAPKPPGINTSKPSLPPKKVTMNGRPTVTRAQSMRAPKSPPIATPTAAMVFPPVGQQMELGRIGTPSFHQSQDSLLHTPPPPRAGTLPMPRSGAASPNRPRLRPPLTRPPPPPPSRVAMSSPPCPPPPPPNVAPPPLPHRVAPPINRFQNMMSNNIAVPPPPPIRHSSTRNGMNLFGGDLDLKFSDVFRSVKEFPPPQPFLAKCKVYNSKTAKQHAPPPPPPTATHIQLGNKMWSRDNTSTC